MASYYIHHGNCNGRSYTVLSTHKIHPIYRTQRWGIGCLYWQLACLLNSLLRLTTRKTSKFHITGPLWRNPPWTIRIPSQRPVMQKASLYNDVIECHNANFIITATQYWHFSCTFRLLPLATADLARMSYKHDSSTSTHIHQPWLWGQAVALSWPAPFWPWPLHGLWGTDSRAAIMIIGKGR